MHNELDRLKEERNNVCSAKQWAAISKQIEVEEQRIQAETFRKEKQMNELVSGAQASINQISILENNYQKLKELYDIHVESDKEAKREIAHNHRISTISIIIAILSLLVAAATLAVTFYK